MAEATAAAPTKPIINQRQGGIMQVKDLKKLVEFADDEALVIFEHWNAMDKAVGDGYHVTGVQNRNYDEKKQEYIPGSFILFSRDPIV